MPPKISKHSRSQAPINYDEDKAREISIIWRRKQIGNLCNLPKVIE